MTIIAIINKITNVCENTIVDERPIIEIPVDDTHFAIDLASTPAIDWVFDENINDYVAVEGMGNGGIGDVLENGKLCQPRPV